MFCREQAVQLHRERDGIAGKGARLAFVGNGNRNFAAAFRDQYGITAPIYVDTRLDSYKALGMKRNPLSVLSVGAMKAAARALGGGSRQGMVQGDAWQLGGVMVVRRGGHVAYRFVSEHPGDHPPVADVLAAL